MKTLGYAAQSAGAELTPFSFERRDLRENDVALEILYCGVCHGDIHYTRDDWGGGIYPMVPGHEIVGRVIAVGESVTRHKIGDHVAVGCFVDSCQKCDQCWKGEEPFCRRGATPTYNKPDFISGENNLGGYAKHIVVREEFVLRVPDGMDMTRAAPLLCAGITTYVPLQLWASAPGSRVGVVGLGGLGHMAVKLAAAFGATVTVISRSEAKMAEALALGADNYLVSTDIEAMNEAQSTFDLIIDTVPTRHDLKPYVALLDVDGTLDVVGQLGLVPEIDTTNMVLGRRKIAGSMVGGVAQTQEMLDFCANEGILPDVEIISIAEINHAFQRLEQSDVRYRFVIDMATLSE